MQRRLARVASLSFAFSSACGGSAPSPTLSTGGNETTSTSTAGEGGSETGGLCDVCVGNEFDACEGGPVDCGELACSDGLGCTECRPGTQTCVGNDVHECGDDGTPGAMTGTCDAGVGEVCSSGACQDACTVAGQDPSNVGCTFWAVDLPNERGINNASAGEWGVVLANAEGDEASVIIERNLAAPGQPLDLQVIATEYVPAGTLKAVSLPTAEVTGTPDPVSGDPPGTALTSNAFRVTSSTPLVVYQFNNFENDFSNDASLLLPQSGLGTVYRVLGYPVANPLALPFPGLPWHSHVTIVGVEANTQVTFRASHLTVSDMIGIPILQPGEEYTTTIGPFDTLVFGSDGLPGDMTGSVVEANRPVAVFSSNEGSSGPSLFGNSEIPNPPGWSTDDTCCTDHVEEQMFPATSLGSTFVIGHSPPRGSSFIEPDELRFLGVAEAATVTTNLAPPWDNFTLQPGDVLDAWTQGETLVESTAPIMVSQHLVSQGRTEAFTGDPAMTVFPPVEQWRDEYLFLVPPSWTQNTIVVSAPVGIALDLDASGLPASCTTTPAGQLAGVDYEVIRCDVDLGIHTIRSGSIKGGDGTPFGLTAYGYASVGSYAYAAGADVSTIYSPPPIP